MSAAGDPCVIATCGTHVQGTIAAPRDRTAGLLLHLQTVHFPGREPDELAHMLPALRRREVQEPT